MNHLLYNVYPIASNRIWEDNLTELFKYIHIFNGQVRFAIKIDEKTIKQSANTWFNYFYSHHRTNKLDIWFSSNNAQLGETNHFRENLTELIKYDGNLFYAHTKGVRHDKEPSKFQKNIELWRNTMYKECLSNPKEIDKILSTYACAGAYKTTGIWSHLPAWIYNGNFWWVNLEKLRQKDWITIKQDRYGVEGYLGNIFKYDEAYCLYGGDNAKRNLYTYDPEEIVYKCNRCKFTHTKLTRCSYCGGLMNKTNVSEL